MPNKDGKQREDPAVAVARQPFRIARWELAVLAVVLALAGLLRWSYLGEVERSPQARHLSIDPAFNDFWARSILDHDWAPKTLVQVYGTLPDVHKTAYLRPPGYPYFLAATYSLFGADYHTVRIIQIVIALASCILGYLLARTMFSPLSGLFFSALLGTYWILIYFESEIAEPALLVFLGLVLALLLHRLTLKFTYPRAVAAGVALGLFALIRANVLLFAPVVLLWAFWLARRHSGRRFRVVGLGFTLAVMLTIAPATIRNYVVADDFVLISSNAGLNLYIGNNPRATGGFVADSEELSRFGSCFEYPRIRADLADRLGHPVKDSQVSRHYASEGFSYIRSNPIQTLALLGKKLCLFWGPHEVALNKAVQQCRVASPTLARIPGNFTLAAVLGLAGAVLLLLESRGSTALTADHVAATSVAARETGLVIVLFVFVYCASFIPFFVTAQYRVPIIPFLLLGAAFALDRLVQFARHKQWRTLSILVASAVVVYLVGRMPFVAVDPGLGKWHFDRALAFDLDGQIDEALEAYRETIKVAPDYIDAHNNLGVLLARSGRLTEAGPHFLQAVRLDPTKKHSQRGAADYYASLDRFAEAEQHYRKAIELDPAYVAARGNLGHLLRSAGRYAEAITQFEQILEIRPDHPGAMSDLAWILATAKDPSHRDGGRAVVLALKANEITGHKHPEMLATLAAAQAETGQFNRAVQVAASALDLTNDDVVRRRLVAVFDKLNEGKPYRE